MNIEMRRNCLVASSSLVLVSVLYISRTAPPANPSHSSESASTSELGSVSVDTGTPEISSTDLVESRSPNGLSSNAPNSVAGFPISDFMKQIIESDKASPAGMNEFSAFATADAVYDTKWKGFVDSLNLGAERNQKVTDILVHYEANNAELSYQFVNGMISLAQSSEGKLVLSKMQDQFLNVLPLEQFEMLLRINSDYTQAISDYFDNAPEIRRNEGVTDVMKFALRGDIGQLKSHVLAGADVNAKDYIYGRTALMDASSNGHIEIVNYLIEAGANLNDTDNTGSTALEAAIYKGNADTVQLLVDAGADTKTVNNMGVSPIALATLYETRGDAYARIIEILRDADRR